jgi:hypothetical protein
MNDPTLVSFAPDMSTCTLRVGDEQYLFDRHVEPQTQPVAEAVRDAVDAAYDPRDDRETVDLAAIVDAFQPQGEPLLDKPASVGGLRFHAGLPIRLLVEAAQRRYEHEESPEGKAEQKRKSDELLAKVTAPLMTQPATGNPQMLEVLGRLLNAAEEVRGHTSDRLSFAMRDARAALAAHKAPEGR